MNRPWIAHYDPGVEPSIDYPEITLPDLFDRTAERYGDRTATVFHGAKLSYRRLGRQIDAFALGLQRSGLRQGERIALMLPNIPQFLVAYYGALKLGAVVVPTNPLYTAPELEHQLADAGATTIVTLDQFFGRVQAALTHTRIRSVVVASVRNALPRHVQPLYSLKQWREGIHAVRRGGVVHRFEDLLTEDRTVTGTPPFPKVAPRDLAVLQYTGGTTGLSKGAMLTHRNLVANALQALSWQAGLAQEELIVLCAAPFFHVYGMTICMNLSVASGATMVLVPRFVPKEVAGIIETYKPQLFPGVPTMYVALANLPHISQRQFSSLQLCLSGAAPLPPEVQNTFETISGASMVEGYGLTEASPVTHCSPLRSCRPGTVGVPWPDTDAMVTDPVTWEPLPPGTVGEMTVSGPQVMTGYWNRPEETAEVLRNGWLHTGDMAVMEPDGFFRIVDRKKDLIIAGGYNVYPREVEDVLYSHPKITEAAVVGVPDAYRGETVKAVIVLREDAQATPDEIIAYCRTHLAAYKVPRIVEFRSNLPKSLIGKVLRRELRTDSAPAAIMPQSKSDTIRTEKQPVA